LVNNCCLFSNYCYQVVVTKLKLIYSFLGNAPDLLKYNIGYILGNGKTKKIPRIVALVKRVLPTDADLKITLRDPTGEMEGALHRRAIESHPSIVSGAVIVLEQVFTIIFLPYFFAHLQSFGIKIKT